MNTWKVSEPAVAYRNKKNSFKAIFDGMPIENNKIAIFPYNLYGLKLSKYASLHNKLSKIEKLPANWDDERALKISQKAINMGRLLIEIFQELNLIENKIAIHIFPTFNGGVQFVLDGYRLKADIETLPDGSFTLTKYIGKENKVKEYHYTKNKLQQLKHDLY